MEHRYVIDYTLDGQQESLEVITDSEALTPEEPPLKILKLLQYRAPKL
jgi:hypothetical protein